MHIIILNVKVPEKALFYFVSELEAENERFYLICTTFKVGNFVFDCVELELNFVFDCVELELNFAELSTFQKKTGWIADMTNPWVSNAGQ